MAHTWFRWLCCPHCRGPFTPGSLEESPGESDNLTLTCDCSEYPVIAGIPIFKTGAIGTAGQTGRELLALLKAGRSREALRALIAPFSPTLAPPWLHRLPAIRGIGRLKSWTHRRALRHWPIEDLCSETSVGQIFDLYYRRRGQQSNYEYFVTRFGQPHYLVAVSLASLIAPPTRPLLDLACGFGHLTSTLVRHAAGQLVIGLDHHFFMLFGAKRWLAPEAAYVCADADAALPFGEGTFAGVLCSNAFHAFVNKALCLQELQRVIQPSGLILLAGMNTATLPPAGYRRLMADLPHRLTAEEDVLVRYFQRQGPPLARSTDRETRGPEPWLSIVASRQDEVFQDHGHFSDWPHAKGRLGLNPFYYLARADRSEGRVRLRRTFPSQLFETRFAISKTYLPETITVETDVLDDLIDGQRTPAVDALIACGAVVGMPESFEPEWRTSQEFDHAIGSRAHRPADTRRVRAHSPVAP
jgi:SAM-dependent methyltransferase/uncharacterized protein YbaR (Trm112 family)